MLHGERERYLSWPSSFEQQYIVAQKKSRIYTLRYSVRFNLDLGALDSHKDILNCLIKKRKHALLENSAKLIQGVLSRVKTCWHALSIFESR